MIVVYSLAVRPAGALAGAPRTFLQIAYEGDVARVYAGGRFDNRAPACWRRWW